MRRVARLLPLSFLAFLAIPGFCHAESFGLETVAGKTADKVESVETSVVQPTVNTVTDEVEKATEQIKESVSESSEIEAVPVEEVQQTVRKTVDSVKEVTKQTGGKVLQTGKSTVNDAGDLVEKNIKPTINTVNEKVQPISEVVTVEKIESKVEKSFEQITPPSVPTSPVEEVVEETAEKLEEVPLIKKEQQKDVAEPAEVINDSNPSNSNPVSNKASSVEVKRSIQEENIQEVNRSLQEENAISDRDLNIPNQQAASYREQSKEETKPFTLPPNTTSFSKAVVTAPVVTPNSSIVPLQMGQDLGQSALVENFVLDYSIGRQWRNPEENGNTQWIHAPPTKPPMALSFLNDLNK